MRTNWLSDRPVGEWYGVTTDGDGRVTGLALSDNNLHGSIPADLGRLDGMAWLDLRRNRLSGSIPAALGDLDSLTHLYLAGNSLTGCVPARLRGELSNDFASLGLPFCQQSSASAYLGLQVTHVERQANSGRPLQSLRIECASLGRCLVF